MTAQHTGASTDPGSKSAAEVEREVEQSRARVGRTLDEIQDRLSPGRLVDQAVTYLRDGGGGEFARNLGQSVRQNPMPVALVALGVAWMMMSGRRTDDRNGYGRSIDWDEDLVGDEPEASPLYPPAYDPLQGGSGWSPSRDADEDDGGASSFDRARDAADRARDVTRRAKGKADDLVGQAGEAVSDAAEGARVGAGALRGKARESMASARDGVRGAGARARRYGRRARHGILEGFYQQPLALGAIGVALGAAIGAALPPTETEDELMGDTRDRLKRDAEEAGREQLAKARATAEAAAAAGRDEAKRQGLSTDAAKSAAEAVRGKVERVAEAATEGAREQAEKEDLAREGDLRG